MYVYVFHLLLEKDTAHVAHPVQILLIPLCDGQEDGLGHVVRMVFFDELDQLVVVLLVGLDDHEVLLVTLDLVLQCDEDDDDGGGGK